MKYYKIIRNNFLKGVSTTYDLRRYIERNQVLVDSNENMAQLILCGDTMYHASWMRKCPNIFSFQCAQVVEIPEQDYNNLKTIINSNEEVIEEPIEEETIEEPIEIIESNPTLEFAKETKLSEIRKRCHQTIVDGLDIELSDGQVHHFSLTEQDQFNLMFLTQYLKETNNGIPYHADGELCVYYSEEDMNTIINGATEFITYHITYHNSLKNYINSLNNIEAIASVEYGTEIPIQYQSVVLQDIYGV